MAQAGLSETEDEDVNQDNRLPCAHDYANSYEFRDPDYTPNDQEKVLIEDAINGYLGLMEEAGLIGYRDGKTTTAPSAPPVMAGAVTEEMKAKAWEAWMQWSVGGGDTRDGLAVALTAALSAAPGRPDGWCFDMDEAPRDGELIYLGWGDPEDWTTAPGLYRDGAWVACAVFHDQRFKPPMVFREYNPSPVCWHRRPAAPPALTGETR